MAKKENELYEYIEKAIKYDMIVSELLKETRLYVTYTTTDEMIENMTIDDIKTDAYSSDLLRKYVPEIKLMEVLERIKVKAKEDRDREIKWQQDYEERKRMKAEANE